MILQLLHGPICPNRAMSSASVTEGSRFPTYLQKIHQYVSFTDCESLSTSRGRFGVFMVELTRKYNKENSTYSVRGWPSSMVP